MINSNDNSTDSSDKNTNFTDNKWTKFDIIFKTIIGIIALLVPISIFYLSAEQKKVERVSFLLAHLASTNANERLLATEVVKYLSKNGEFPEELKNVMLEVANNDDDKRVANSAAQTLAQETKQNEIAPRVIIHIQDSTQQTTADTLREKLKAQGISVPRIYLEENGPLNAQLRFFRRSEENLADTIADSLKLKFKFEAKSKYTPGYEEDMRIPPKYFELWFAKISK